MKTQAIRLVDIFLLGPLMIYSARFSGSPKWLRLSLALAGILTIAYNGENYLRARK